MESWERVKYVMDNEGLNKNSFSSAIGSSNNVTITRIINEQRKPSRSTCEKIVNAFPKYSLIWLLTGEGNIFIEGKAETLIEVNSPKDTIPFEYDYAVVDFFKDYYSYLNYQEIEKDLLEKQLVALTDEESAKIAGIMKLDYEDFTRGIEIVTSSPHTGKLVPVYNAKAAAGKVSVDMHGAREGWVNIGDLLKDSEASLYVYGNSMIPGYPPGSLIGIRPLNESFIEPGSVYVVETESNRYIKRLYYKKDQTAIICMSDNHIKHTDGPMEGEYFYPPFEIPISAIKLIYKVIGVIKRNSISLT